MAETIAVLSQKGGTGKTTTVRTLADAFRRSGVKTLAVDLDPQGNLSDYFDLPPDVEPTIADVLSDRASAGEAIHDDLIPANLTLAEAELMLGGKMGRELTLRRALAKVPDQYELILIDCPPSLGLLTVNALVAADYALITAEAQYFALQGVEQAVELVELARDGLNPELAVLGMLLNLADMRTVHSREALSSLKERFGEQVFDDDDPLVDRLRRVGRARALDPRLPPGSRRRLPRSSPPKCSSACRRCAAQASASHSCVSSYSRLAPGAQLRWLLQLADVSALRLKRRAPQRRPAFDLAR